MLRRKKEVRGHEKQWHFCSVTFVKLNNMGKSTKLWNLNSSYKRKDKK